MLDTNDLLLLGCICCIMSAIFSVLCALVSHWMRNRDVDTLYAKCKSLEMNINGSIGRASRAANSERMEEALAKVAIKVKEGKSPTDAIKETAMEYPDVALAIGKKMMGGQLKLI